MYLLDTTMYVASESASFALVCSHSKDLIDFEPAIIDGTIEEV